MLVNSISYPWDLMAGGQSSLSPSHPPTDSVRSVYSLYLSWLGCRWSRNLKPNFSVVDIFNPLPLDWMSNKLISTQSVPVLSQLPQ